MKSVLVTGPGRTAVVEVEKPVCGPSDVLVRIRACGICGSDGLYIAVGGIPPRQGATPLGHEPAGEIAEVGAEVEGLSVGDHVVLNPMASGDGIIGSGGAQGGLSEFVLLRDARVGVHLVTVPKHIPFEVAALNEPMAVAGHAVNRTAPKPGDKVVVFGAGPVGLGAAIAYELRGAHVVVVDIVANRLEKALRVGAHAVINSAEEDVLQRLVEIHGEAPRSFVRGVRPDTDIYLDAAGAPVVLETALAAAKHGATVGVVAVHKKPVPVDFGALLTTELTLVLSMGYPTEIFEVTRDLVEHWQRYELLISDRIPHADVRRALELGSTPGAAEKVVVTLG
ncbi:threonine dehydrogenase [Actinoplanes lobatus]|uniref:Threonine dehydrogenase n=1 Tax=Actinoplanes lobatus TaxID=113568 RepID=A0A7W7MKJ2_9ACTN|nr:zinc-binding dehydrogenase [Actinoplanes lobatus]MBB4753709.1 threonine dehydrogenase-like Zn-dependent dehydrogenase [Actinoplanes lobatus]GGN72913.1 threonine dehydrogenase [Actinoplanes lobatus]GIE44479.1 threonine dehydrogenase [Actinoplanes lobatus]